MSRFTGVFFSDLGSGDGKKALKIDWSFSVVSFFIFRAFFIYI